MVILQNVQKKTGNFHHSEFLPQKHLQNDQTLTFLKPHKKHHFPFFPVIFPKFFSKTVKNGRLPNPKKPDHFDHFFF